MEVLRQRSEFLRTAQGRRQGAGSFMVQARDRADGTTETRVGFTASKKIGNAVARNRAKRRLRAVARELLLAKGKPGWDYVLVARPEATIGRSYEGLLADLETALSRLHQ